LILSKKFLNQRASEGYANDYPSGNAAGLKLVSELNQIAETSAKPIKPPNHQSVPRTQIESVVGLAELVGDRRQKCEALLSRGGKQAGL
jgi:hypothetical protein